MSALSTVGSTRLPGAKPGRPDAPVTELLDFALAENGLTAFCCAPLPSNSFIRWIIIEDQYKASCASQSTTSPTSTSPPSAACLLSSATAWSTSALQCNASSRHEERLEFERYDKEAAGVRCWKFRRRAEGAVFGYLG